MRFDVVKLILAQSRKSGLLTEAEQYEAFKAISCYQPYLKLIEVNKLLRDINETILAVKRNQQLLIDAMQGFDKVVKDILKESTE